MTPKQDVAVREETTQPPVIRTEQPGSDVAFIQMIERVSQLPDVRMDVLQGLVAMRNDELKRVAKLAYDEAMASAQAEMEPVRKDASNPQTRSKYASYDALDRAIRPIYTKHGFSVRFDTADAPRELEIRVVAKVSHRGGYEDTCHLDVPVDGKGAKGNDVMTKTHAVMSGLSYGKRGTLGMAFNVATTEKDDDGNAAGAGETITEDQQHALQSLMMEHDIPPAKFFKVMKIDKLSDLPVRDLPEANRQLQEAIAVKTRKREGAPA